MVVPEKENFPFIVYCTRFLETPPQYRHIEFLGFFERHFSKGLTLPFTDATSSTSGKGPRVSNIELARINPEVSKRFIAGHQSHDNMLFRLFLFIDQGAGSSNPRQHLPGVRAFERRRRDIRLAQYALSPYMTSDSLKIQRLRLRGVHDDLTGAKPSATTSHFQRVGFSDRGHPGIQAPPGRAITSEWGITKGVGRPILENGLAINSQRIPWRDALSKQTRKTLATRNIVMGLNFCNDNSRVTGPSSSKLLIPIVTKSTKTNPLCLVTPFFTAATIRFPLRNRIEWHSTGMFRPFSNEVSKGKRCSV
ncbi:hypothetical protein DFH06DRAFT_1132357 [Mycena polygramma]|nr:hypothetical protein DFH06DRAFT_1132357 [Mycena polygramma]